MRIYLDVCCLSRPFDDHTQDRVRLESEAVLAIISHGLAEHWTLLNSEVIDLEISKIPDSGRTERVRLFSSVLRPRIGVDEAATKRADQLNALGFKPYDALHIACAEKGRADILLTTDDDLINKASQNKGILRVRLDNPLAWLIKEMKK
ncbi:MAG: PIN domain-containing protein [Nitrospirota bacterium]